MEGVSSRGPSLTNRDPDNNLGGEDRALISLGVAWVGVVRDFFEFLEEKREEAEELGEAVEVMIGNRAFALSPKGSRPSKGAPYYRWILSQGDVRYLIARREECTDEYPNVLVDIGSLALMQAGGLGNVWPLVLERLRQMGCSVRWNKLSRVDACVDLVGVSVEEFTALLRGRCYSSRGRKLREFSVETYSVGRRDTGFVIGTKVMLRVYDKLAETEHDERKRAALVTLRWGGVVPEAATRVEWQLRREQIAEYGVDTVEDWLKLCEGIVGDLCERWFRLTEGEFDPNHSARCKTHPLWLSVTGRFLRAFASVVREARRSFIRAFRPERLPRQAVGCLVSSVASTVGKCADVGEFLAAAYDIVDRVAAELGASELLDRVRQRALEFSSGVPDTSRRRKEKALLARQQSFAYEAGRHGFSAA